MKRLLPFLLLLITSFSYSQTVTENMGSVALTKDARLDLLSAKQIEINRRAKLMNTTSASGYRIQVINTQSRDEANNVKAEMLRRFPELKAYLLYKAPNYKVRVVIFYRNAMQSLFVK